MVLDKNSQSIFSRDSVKLFLCGAAVLYFELVLIRWMGSCIRIVSYFSNFILVSAFLGLGAGALLAKKNFNLGKYIVPAVCFCLFFAPLLGLFGNYNPDSDLEYLWIGGVRGPVEQSVDTFLGMQFNTILPFWIVLTPCFLVNAGVFLIFGQMLGIMFQKLPPLKAYSLEIAGSVLGILLFGAMSLWEFSPTAWFVVGFILLFCVVDFDRKVFAASALCCLAVLASCWDFEKKFIWSPYYKIKIFPFRTLADPGNKNLQTFKEPFGFKLVVNNDYHQMIVNLSAERNLDKEHDFFKSWRLLYDYPLRNYAGPEEGPILILAGGTGNDVSAALRNTKAQIDVVEIDPNILELGKIFHPEAPYANPRVHVFNDDARSYIARAEKKYAAIVYGFLDSHTLLSSFSSVRLDNFVYTQEAMRQAKNILEPGGKIYLTFATNRPWIHLRLIHLLDSVFDFPTQVHAESKYNYSNGMIYENGKAPASMQPAERKIDPLAEKVKLSTDDWPFLYMKEPSLPAHYVIFICMALALSFSALWLLPKNERSINFKYFFMGAGFFLVETGNIVKLSLLYGSTWVVNVTVFTGVLVFILLGNLVSTWIKGEPYHRLFLFLFGSAAASYFVAPAELLTVASPGLQAVAAVALFLGPIFFASLIFAKLIAREPKLYEAYGSNLLGAMVGGAAEYLSILMGFRFLTIAAVVFYFLAYLCIQRFAGQTPGQRDAGLSRS